MRLAVSALCALVALCALPADARQDVPLEELLRRTAGYVAAFHKQLSGIVAEETYEQIVPLPPRPADNGLRRESLRRRLKSDFLLVRPVGADRYVEFRDVFEVDGRPVRDREERLSELFLNPPPGAAGQLQRVVHESARYNIGPIERTLNTPFLALGFLAERYQPRFMFRLRSTAGETALLEYRERESPTLIQTPSGLDVVASGRFWIDVASGAVSRSELVATGKDVRARITVTYEREPRLGFRVPVSMREQYDSRGEQIEGHAKYGRFRQFQVNVDETIKPVK